MWIFDIGKPLTSASDNLHMSRLAKIARVVTHPAIPGIGDSIDQGLITLRLLNEAGYDVVPREKPLPSSFLPTLDHYVEIISRERAQ